MPDFTDILAANTPRGSRIKARERTQTRVVLEGLTVERVDVTLDEKTVADATFVPALIK